MTVTKKEKRETSIWTIFILLASIISLFNQIFIVLIKSDPELKTLLIYLDDAFCLFFIIDFAYRFYTAENKIDYMRWGWIDLVSSIPVLGWSSFSRAVRILRIFRVLRAFKNFHVIMHLVFRDRVKGTFYSIISFALFLIFASSIVILMAEEHVHSTIKTAEDAIWWTLSTISTVGYGDKVPVTTLGRIIGALVMLSGVAVSACLTAYVTYFFVEHEEDSDLREIKRDLAEIKEILRNR